MLMPKLLRAAEHMLPFVNGTIDGFTYDEFEKLIEQGRRLIPKSNK